MTSTVRIFKDTKITPERNFMVDDIELYLATCNPYEVTKFQYQKHALLKSIKLDMTQATQEFDDIYDYNYCAIQNSNSDRVVYYFITNKNVKSQECVELELRMDTAITFDYENNDYTILDKTSISRQHRDRYKGKDIQTVGPIPVNITTDIEDPSTPGAWIGYGTFTHPYLKGRQLISLELVSYDFMRARIVSFDPTSGTVTLQAGSYAEGDSGNVNFSFKYYDKFEKVIDLYSEGLTPILYKKESKVIRQTEDTEWALIYKNANNITPTDYNQVNPVDCYLAPVEPTTLDVAPEYVTFVGSSVNNGIISGAYSPIQSHKGSLVFDYSGNTYTMEIWKIGFYEYSVSFEESGGVIAIAWYCHNSVTKVNTILLQVNVPSTTSFKIYPFAGGDSKIYFYKGTHLTLDPEDYPANDYFDLSPTTKDITMFDKYDRTDSRFIKIFMLPYSPSAINNGVIDSSWSEEVNGLTSNLKLNYLNTKFDYTFLSDIYSPFKILMTDLSSSKLNGNGRLLDNKDISFEPKLYHSDYYRPTFVYDSFVFPFFLERVDIDKLSSVYETFFKIRYVVTTTINSKFMFMFPEYTLAHSTEDFDNVLPIARNNEAVLYSNQYINYLRTGYNYDVKSRHLAAANSILGALTGTAGAIAFASIAKAGGGALLASAIIGGVTGIIMSANTIASNEMALQTKIKQSKYQSVTTEGSDDIDLLEAYSDNKAYLNTYEVSDRLKQALFKVFYYTGYTYELMEVPNMTSRIRFNFCMANLVIKRSSNMPQYAEEDLINRWSQGITRIHNFHGTWDFDQEYENWETSLGGIY